jgi:hypothetical protein
VKTKPGEPAGVVSPPEGLQKALRHLLRPLVRLLLEQRLTYPMLTNLLKSVYLEVALRDFPIEGKRQTDSRLSLLTGLHRKDVRRLRAEAARGAATPIPPAVALGAQLVGRWTGTPDYLDREGRPRPLPRLAGPGRGPSFEELVASVSKDIRPRAVLDEWLRLGVATVDADDRVSLNVEAFVPARGFEEKAWYLGRNLHDHLAAAARNLGGRRSPLLERAVYYGALTRESVAELAKLAARVGTEGVQAVNRRALELRRRDAGKRGARMRMRFGVYFYEADTADEDEPGEARAATARRAGSRRLASTTT